MGSIGKLAQSVRRHLLAESVAEHRLGVRHPSSLNVLVDADADVLDQLDVFRSLARFGRALVEAVSAPCDALWVAPVEHHTVAHLAAELDHLRSQGADQHRRRWRADTKLDAVVLDGVAIDADRLAAEQSLDRGGVLAHHSQRGTPRDSELTAGVGAVDASRSDAEAELAVALCGQRRGRHRECDRRAVGDGAHADARCQAAGLSANCAELKRVQSRAFWRPERRVAQLRRLASERALVLERHPQREVEPQSYLSNRHCEPPYHDSQDCRCRLAADRRRLERNNKCLPS